MKIFRLIFCFIWNDGRYVSILIKPDTDRMKNENLWPHTKYDGLLGLMIFVPKLGTGRLSEYRLSVFLIGFLSASTQSNFI